MTLQDKKHIAACDTQPVTAEGLRTLLASCDDLAFIDTTDSLATAADMIRRRPPDVLVVDKALGIQSVLDWVMDQKVRDARVSVVVWGVSITEAEALRFLQAGARGIIRKTAPLSALLTCLRAVASGQNWMEDCVFRAAVRPERYPRSELTPREQQVLELVEQGLRNKEIAGELGIRPGTVKIHLKHIFEKTGVRGRYGLALNGLKDKGVLSLTAQ
jgi:DNA-binding NarL/FixJ family response regulator